MSAQPVVLRKASNSYNIFILVLTIFSLVLMVLLLLPFEEATLQVMTVFDNAICVIFLADFFMNLAAAKPKRAYFIDQRGWLDLLGSIPSLGILRLTGLLRLARLSRLARITRLLRGNNRAMLVKDVIENRGQYAVFITVMAAFLVLAVSTILMTQFESSAPDANITTGGDALWWGFTTITTVGYGDEFPVTPLGRVTAVFVMFAGVGIIGSLASILASVLVPPPRTTETPQPVSPPPANDALADELASIKEELIALRRAMSSQVPEPTGDPTAHD
jgi:voltage-gated potassium channel